MTKIICTTKNLIPQKLDNKSKYFSMYETSKRDDVGYFASTLFKDIRRSGLIPSAEIMDFLSISLSVAAADKAVTRQTSPDGWTREMELSIKVSNPNLWDTVKTDFENTLRFLSGDIWHLTFDGGMNYPLFQGNLLIPKLENCDCVSLLSGGVDSLIGAIDLIEDNRNPVFISQAVRKECANQVKFARLISSSSPHLQWSSKIHTINESEPSTRARSIIFIAFALLASSALKSDKNNPAEIIIPENGFISLNIALNKGRIGSLSTKTTHPIYLQGLQSIWDKVGINAKFITPYQFKTKGELVDECKNLTLLKALINDSVSCGKYGRNSGQHCGRCVPCMVRRAAFKKAKIKDLTAKGYKFPKLKNARKNNGPDDVGAMLQACATVSTMGIKKFTRGQLGFAASSLRDDYEDVVLRGIREVEEFLSSEGVQ